MRNCRVVFYYEFQAGARAGVSRESDGRSEDPCDASPCRDGLSAVHPRLQVCFREKKRREDDLFGRME